MSADVKPGYKQTEIGVIPDDWSVCELGDLAPYVTSGSRGWAEYYSDRGDPFVRITNLSRSTIYIDQADLKFVRIPDGDSEGQRTALIDGDILISITADIGIIGYVDSSLSKPAYINQHIALVRFKDLGVDSKYLSYFLAGEVTQRLFRSSTDQGAKAGMNLVGIRSIKAVLPPIAEQRAISAALSEMDNLLSSQDQLIAKKRDIQQAAMQQLLSGQRRLPGFSGAWEVKRFGEVVVCRSERVDPRSAGRQDFCVELEHIEPRSGRLIGQTVAEESSSLKTAFKRRDVLFGKLRAYQRKYWFAERSGVCSTEIWALSCDTSRLLPEFLYHCVKTDAFIEVASTAYGTHMPRSDWKVMKHFEISLPTCEEQTAIATILSDMDAELAALEARRNKALQLKQGMMQELLTGRIRLVR